MVQVLCISRDDDLIAMAQGIEQFEHYHLTVIPSVDHLTICDVLLLDAACLLPDETSALLHGTGCPVLVLIAPEQSDWLDAYLDAGVRDFLQVPFTPRQLHHRVALWTGQHEGLLSGLAQFAGSMAHDLKNPLSSVRGYAGLLLQLSETEHDRLSEKQTRFVNTILRNAGRMEDLIQDMRDMQYLRAGRDIVFDPEPMIPDGVIQTVVESQSAQADENGQTITVTLPDSPMMIWADSERLTQIMSCLLENAIHHATHESTIDLTATAIHRDDQPLLQLSLVCTCDDIRLNELQALFDPGTPDSFRRRLNAPGLALRLQLAQALVHLHGGWLSVNEEGDQQVCFVVVLPLVEIPEEGQDA